MRQEAAEAAPEQPQDQRRTRSLAINLSDGLRVTEQLAYNRLLLEAERTGELQPGELRVLRTVLRHVLDGTRPKSKDLRARCRSSTIVALKAKEWLGCSLRGGRAGAGTPSWFLRVPEHHVSTYSGWIVGAREELYAFCMEFPQGAGF